MPEIRCNEITCFPGWPNAASRHHARFLANTGHFDNEILGSFASRKELGIRHALRSVSRQLAVRMWSRSLCVREALFQ
jgi:hypothetical protein